MPRFGNDVVQTGQDDGSLLDVPTWDMVKATAAETFGSNPTEALTRSDSVRMQRASGDRLDLRLPYLREDPNAPRYVQGVEAPKLSQAQAQAKVDAAGLTGRLEIPAEGENEKALDLLIQYKSDEVRNQFILGNYRGGIAGGAAQLATGLAVSLVDPINIGSAFVPVVGESRYAQLLGRAGTSMTSRAGVRAGVGAVEGTFGAALVEPIIYQSKQAIQADYGTMDSMMNIGFGGLFGGVLQPAAGGVSDVLARRAGIGAWAENVRPDMMADDPVAPEGFTLGGGTRYIEGEDYVRGQWAVAEASTLRSTGTPFEVTETGQLGASPWSDSGAPVVGSDGAVRNGNRRMASILRDYEGEGNADYRSNLIEQAEQYGLDSDQIQAMERPVLVRVEGSRDVGAWGEYRKIAENSPQARAARESFASPDVIAARAFTARARGLGVADEAAEALAPVAPRDDVTGFYDGRQDGMKAATVQRALDHLAETGQEGVYVSADISNLGGLNAAMGNRAEAANVHFQAMAGIMERELRALGGDVVPMRTGGDELGAVVVGANVAQVDVALTKASAAVAKYARENGLADIPHPKRSDSTGVGLHFGLDELRPGDDLSKIFDAADAGVDLSKNGDPYGRKTQVEAFRAARAGTPAGQPRGAEGRTTQADRPESGRAVPATEAAPRLTEEQQRAATQIGVAQVVNGERLNVAAVGELDGTTAGVERFLEAKRVADAAEVTARDRQASDMDALRRDIERFDPANAAKLDKELADMEAQLREQVKAAGGNEADIDAALAEVTELTEAADTESKALRGVALCMLRSA